MKPANPDTTEAEKLAPVIQADRDRAWPFRPSCYKDNPATRHNWRDGVYDKLPIIQAFANTRLALATPIADRELAVVDAVREALAQVCDRHINLALCKQLFPESHRGAFAMASHLAADLRSTRLDNDAGLTKALANLAQREQAALSPPAGMMREEQSSGVVDREAIARIIEPEAWRYRDQIALQRDYFEQDLRHCWPELSFDQWRDRGVGKSLATADAILAHAAATKDEALSDVGGDAQP